MRAATYFWAYVRCRNILSDVDVRYREGHMFTVGFAKVRWKRYARLARKLERKLEAMLDEEEET